MSFSCLAAFGVGRNDDTDSLLRVLDGELPARDIYKAERQERISAARADLARVAGSDGDAYNVLRSLYSLYRAFDVDSALWVARMRLDVANRLGDTDKVLSAKLNVAESSIAMGSLQSAERLLDGITRQPMHDYQRRYTYGLYSKLYHNLGLNDGIPADRRRYELLEKAYLDSLAVCNSLRAGDLSLSTRARAVLRSGQMDLAKNLLAQAALEDVREGRRDMESLSRLAGVLCEEGDYERAYNYISIALDEAREAKAYSRTAEILQAVSVIERAHNAMVRESTGRMRVALGIIVALTLITVLALIYMVILLSANRRVSRNLKEANGELEKANKMKETHISRLFDSHSQHIGQITDLRKKCLRQLRAGKLEQLENTLSSHFAENVELQGMYARFDEMFLSMYPRFIADYNGQVSEEYRVDPSTDVLTPELRVQALITMGITDSGSIARLLHYSPQTVYNYRSRLRMRMNVHD